MSVTGMSSGAGPSPFTQLVLLRTPGRECRAGVHQQRNTQIMRVTSPAVSVSLAAQLPHKGSSSRSGYTLTLGLCLQTPSGASALSPLRGPGTNSCLLITLFLPPPWSTSSILHIQSCRREAQLRFSSWPMPGSLLGLRALTTHQDSRRTHSYLGHRAEAPSWMEASPLSLIIKSSQ